MKLEGSSIVDVAVSRRSFLAAGAGLGLASLGVSGCSNFSGGTGNSGGASDSFTWTFWGTANEKTVVTNVVSTFCKENNLKPNVQNIAYADYTTKINTLIAANTPPDAGYMIEGVAMRLGSQGKLVSMAGKPGFEDLLPGVLHYWDKDNAVAQSAVEVNCLFYNKAATAKAGVTPPATIANAWNWDAFVSNADKLTKDRNGKSPSESGFDPKAVAQYGVTAPSDLINLVALFKGVGLDMFNDDGTACNIGSADAIRVVQAVSDLIFKHRVAPTPAQAGTYGGNTALLLQSGRVAMAPSGQYALLDFASSKLDYDVGVLPAIGTPLTTSYGGASVAFTGGKHQDQAVQLLSDLNEPDKVDLFSSGLWMPTAKKFYTDEALIKSWTDNKAHPAGYRTAVLDPALNDAVPYFSYKLKNGSQIESTLSNGLQPLFAKESDIAAALKKLASNVNKMMQGAYPDVIGS